MNALVLAVVALHLTMGSGSAFYGQSAVAPAPAQTSRASRPADVNRQDAILAALYDVISGPGGQQRDWACASDTA